MAEDLTVVTPYGRRAGSARVRCFDWLDHLGLSPTVVSYTQSADNSPKMLATHPLAALRAQRALRALRTTGPITLFREAGPFGRGGTERRLLSQSRYGVYDFDDALFHDAGTGLRRLSPKDQKCLAAAQAADVVIAGNDYLADWAGAHNDNVVVIPSCVEPDDYQMKTEWSIGESPRIVWLGSPSTEQFLVPIADALLRVHRATGARLTMISAGDAPLGPLRDMVDRIQWTPQNYLSLLAGADVGIGPLTDTPYARGKCAYKVLQYAAAGLPVVASPVGANVLATNRFDGLLAEGPSEWVEALTAMIVESEARRSARGSAARAAVQEHYSFRAWADTWRSKVLQEDRRPGTPD